MRSFGSIVGLWGGLLVACSFAVNAGAQPRPAPPPTPAPTPAPPAEPATPVADAMAPSPGGLTAEQVAERAAATSYQAKAAEENANAAAARAEQSYTNFYPRFGVTGRYTRLSEFTPPSFGGGGSIVATLAPAGTVNPTPTVAASLGGFPIIPDQWLTQATIAVPISDYFLKISKSYTAATQQEEAARYDIAAARAKSYADGKIVFFTWLRARGALVVAEQSLAVAKAHLTDAQNQFAVGNASKADVLRAETQVAAADLAVARAKSGIVVTERQVRVAMHTADEAPLRPGESLDGALSPLPPSPKPLVAEALGARPEIKSIDRNAAATRKLADAQRANRWPSLSGFGDVTYANPNPRKIPQAQEWFPTWAVGAQVTWSPNDFVAASPAAQDLEARAAALEAQKGVIRDGVELEVTQAYQAVVEADIAIATTERQLESATEGYRVARELFNAGRGTATTLVDAETVLAQTRFEHLNARVDARVARTRLDYALGRYVRTAMHAP